MLHILILLALRILLLGVLLASLFLFSIGHVFYGIYQTWSAFPEPFDAHSIMHWLAPNYDFSVLNMKILIISTALLTIFAVLTKLKGIFSERPSFVMSSGLIVAAGSFWFLRTFFCNMTCHCGGGL